jgi:ribosomal protein S18 acetylase RimI-like enzyme
VRAPTVADADDLGRVHVRAWQAAYRGGLMPDEYLDALSNVERATMWREALEQGPRARSSRLVAEVDDEMVGFAIVGPAAGDLESPIGELYAINVDPDHWATGVGSDLIAAAMAELKASAFTSVVLWVHPDNVRARRFYESRGWSDDRLERRQDVLGVEVPETRYSRLLP